ncbi:clostripain-related cysteine peptidase [Bacteroides congonensis]
METTHKYFRLIQSVFFILILLLSFSMSSCEKEEPVSTPPSTRQTDPPVDDLTDFELSDPIIRPDNEQTVFMYLPWSTNLTSNFKQNITDLRKVVARNILKNERIIVFMCTKATEASLFELVYEDGKEVRKTYKNYEYPSPSYTTVDGIAAILNDVETYAPAKRYAMIIGCHGLGWIPVSNTQSRSKFSATKRHWEYENVPMTRSFGGLSPEYQTDITTLAEGITRVGLKMEYILFDDCYMSGVEVAYDLKDVTEHLIASTSEVMAYGMPYAEIGEYLIGEVNYEKICDGFYSFYSNYTAMPCGTLAVTDCSELENLATIMKDINSQYTFDPTLIGSLQRLDGYSPAIFFDCEDYVSKLCPDQGLLAQFKEQLDRTVPFKRNTDYYYTMTRGKIKIDTFSGITISDPSTSTEAAKKKETAWYIATH